jgi:uncharacterized protein (DUF433 family)
MTGGAAVGHRDGPAGRRAALSASGLDVWEVIETLRNAGNHVDRTARYHGISEEQVRAALAYERAHPDEIAARIRAERALAEREHARRRARDGA